MIGILFAALATCSDKAHGLHDAHLHFAEEAVTGIFSRDVGSYQSKVGIEFVHRTVSFDTWIIFGDSLATEYSGGSLVSGFGHYSCHYLSCKLEVGRISPRQK